MADTDNFLLLDKLHWTCTRSGRIFSNVGKAPPMVCGLCGAVPCSASFIFAKVESLQIDASRFHDQG
jgi:hypothetical protein